MIKNYFKIAWRNLRKNKVYSFINLLGLTIGMTCFILIAFYIQYEISHDKHFANSDRIYRIVQQQEGNAYRGTDFFALAPIPLGTAMLSDFPEVEYVTNLNVWTSLLVNGENSFSERGLFTDSSFFDVFETNVLSGSGKEALEDTNSILLTESLSEKIFGANASIGKTILYNSKELIVKGIIADPPPNQHFTYSFIASSATSTQFARDRTDWVSNNYHSYLLLKEGQDYTALEAKMSGYEKITKPAYKSHGFQFYPQFSLQPLKDIYLRSKMNKEIQVNGDIKFLYFFGLLALIILALASINYMNLATSRSVLRTKEVGVFKALGAGKRNLVFQYLSESILLTIFSFVIAIFLVIMFLPEFNAIIGKEIPLNMIDNGWILIGMLSIAILVGSLSGLYPAIFLSSINTVNALKGKGFNTNKGTSLLRNSLVVGQFAVAMGLITGSFIITQQLQFIQEKKLGYNKEHVVHMSYFNQDIAKKEAVIKSELLNHPKIHKVSISTQLPISVTSQGPISNWEGNLNQEQLYIYRTYVDYNFLDLFEMNMVEGRGFSEKIASDSTDAFILNEAAVKKLGWKSAVGKQFNEGNVIGVVEDFHLQTFDLSIEPLFMKIRNESWSKSYGQVILKISLDDYEGTKAFIENTMKQVAPLELFELKFLDDTYLSLYDKEKKLGEAFNIFAILALFIAGMGLFGLVSFHVFQRTKEIGVRKVLGASVYGIIRLIAKEFLKLIGVALLIAIPLSYYLMSNWLQEYIYRIDLKWWVFASAGIIVVSIALLTVIMQALKAATANPIKSLRTE